MLHFVFALQNVSMTSPNLSDDGMALMIAEEPQSSESPVQRFTGLFFFTYGLHLALHLILLHLILLHLP